MQIMPSANGLGRAYDTTCATRIGLSQARSVQEGLHNHDRLTPL